MNKKLPLIIISFFALVVFSILTVNYWHTEEVERPEGYSKPEKEAKLKDKGPVRVMDLDISENANKYFTHRVRKGKSTGNGGAKYSDNYALEMLAFAPGSGWLRWKTRDGITPILEFKKVTQRDIHRFNQFPKSIQMPIRLALSGKILRIWAEETQKDLSRFMQADGTIKQYKSPKGFFKLKAPPEVMLAKDKDGKVFIVHKKDKDEEKPAEAVALQAESN